MKRSCLMTLRFVKIYFLYKLPSLALTLDVSRVVAHTPGSSKSSFRQLQAALKSLKYSNVQKKVSVVYVFSPR